VPNVVFALTVKNWGPSQMSLGPNRNDAQKALFKPHRSNYQLKQAVHSPILSSCISFASLFNPRVALEP